MRIRYPRIQIMEGRGLNNYLPIHVVGAHIISP